MSLLGKARDLEGFVLKQLTESLPGSRWVRGEDPPDGYVHLPDGSRVAVEVSTLTQHVRTKRGRLPRLTLDARALHLVDQVDEAVRLKSRASGVAYLTLRAPVKEPGRLKADLVRVTTAMLGAGRPKTQAFSLHGNAVQISLHPAERPSGKKVVGIVTNRFVRGPAGWDIGANAADILLERIRVKAEKMARLEGKLPLWLALYNDYFLANADTYRLVLKHLPPPHPFQRIVLVGSAGVQDLVPGGNPVAHLVSQSRSKMVC